MRRNARVVPLFACLLVLSVGSACHRYGGLNYRRSMPAEARLDVRCIEYPLKTEVPASTAAATNVDDDRELIAMNSALTGLYAQGYRMAWSTESTRTFLGIPFSTKWLYCLERPSAAVPPPAAAPKPPPEVSAVEPVKPEPAPVAPAKKPEPVVAATKGKPEPVPATAKGKPEPVVATTKGKPEPVTAKTKVIEPPPAPVEPEPTPAPAPVETPAPKKVAVEDESTQLHNLYLAAYKQAQSGQGFTRESVPRGSDRATQRRRSAFLLGVRHATENETPYTQSQLLDYVLKNVE